MKKALTILLIVLFGWLPLKSQEYTAMPWCTIPHDAHSTALGGSTALFSSMGLAALNNPTRTLLFDEEKKCDIVAGWQNWKPSANHFVYAGAGYTHGILGCAIAYAGGIGPEFTPSDIGGNPGSKTRSHNHQFNLSLGIRLLPILSIGVTGKYLLDNNGVGGKQELFAGDFFALLDLFGVQATVGLRNLSNSYTYNGIEYKLPLSVVGGLGYQKRWEDFGLEIGAEYEAFLTNKDQDEWQGRIGGGISLFLFDFLSLKGGYNWGNTTPLSTYTSLGLGFEFETLALEASYLLNADKLAGDMISIQLGINF